MNLRGLSALQVALGISVAVHAVVLTARFVDPEGFNRVFDDTPLEVILVNAKATERPDKAKALAQASMAGGGDAAAGRATTPLPAAELAAMGDAMEDTQRKMDALQTQQMVILAQVKKQIASLPVPDPKTPSSHPQVQAQEEKRRQLVKLLGEIERRITEENERPKKRYISPATKEVVYAVYYDHLRQKIEDRGTQNFPQAAGKKLYGELTMAITVNHDGHVLSTEVVQTSGNLALDRRAQAIVNSAGPFGKFNEPMRRKADQIVLVSRFKFTREALLETKLMNR